MASPIPSPAEISTPSEADMIAEGSINIMMQHFQTMLSFLEDLNGE